MSGARHTPDSTAYFAGLGKTSAPFLSAIALASDLLPLREDMSALLGGEDDRAGSWTWKAENAAPGILALLLVLVPIKVVDPEQDCFCAAESLMSVGEDVRAAIMR